MRRPLAATTLIVTTLCHPVAARGLGVPCPGRYVVRGQRLLVEGGQPLRRDAVVVQGDRVRIDGGCAAQVVSVQRGDGTTDLTAEWPRCGRLDDVVLRAEVDDACRTMRGTVQAGPHAPRRFVARRSSSLQPTACAFTRPFGQRPDDVQCATLRVPERRRPRPRRSVDLALAVLKATGPPPWREPLIFLNGGPGGATLPLLIQAYVRFAAAPVQARRDIVFVDLRGTGLSAPSLGCPEYDAAQAAWQSRDELLAALAACRDRLVRQGVDLSAYTSAEAAADVRDVMTQLGYSTWSVEGLSYGSRVALAVLRRDAHRIRSVVLDSPVPWQFLPGLEFPVRLQATLHALFAQCQADPSCAAAFPNVEETLYALVTALDAAPVTVDLPDLATGTTRTRVVTGQHLLQIVQAALFDYDQLRKLPAVITRVAQGEPAALAEIPGLPQSPTTFQWGAFFSTWCAEDVPFYTPELIARTRAALRPELQVFGLGAIEFNVAACARWRSRRGASVRRRPVTSRVPALVMAGELDPDTEPPSYAETVAATLPNSFVFTLRGFPHAVSFYPVSDYFALRPTCGFRLTGEFLDDPTRRPAAPCVGMLPAVTFAGS